ncbi:Triosephosphate isomerase [subsurface metagenome]
MKYVIIGHSERRKYFKETDEMTAKKLKAVLKVGLKPILCIDKLSQIPKNIKGKLIIAYEPLFAIGTGKACSPQRAKKMRLSIKKIVGSKIPILYGGSVSSQNAKLYIKQAGFQGLLVGGASLKPQEFVDIIKRICYAE